MGSGEGEGSKGGGRALKRRHMMMSGRKRCEGNRPCQKRRGGGRRGEEGESRRLLSAGLHAYMYVCMHVCRNNTQSQSGFENVGVYKAHAISPRIVYLFDFFHLCIATVFARGDELL